MLSEISQRKTNTVYHLHVESKKYSKLVNTENRLAVAWGYMGVGKVGEGGQRDKLPVISPGDITYNTVTIVNNTLLYVWKLLRE